jgi:hypothetical protein
MGLFQFGMEPEPDPDVPLPEQCRFPPSQPSICEGQSYQLVHGPNFDQDAALRIGKSDQDCISAVFVTEACRFGNSVQQVSHALDIAIHHGLKSVYVPGFWWLKDGVTELPNGLRLVNRPGVLFDDEEVLVTGMFFDTTQLTGLRGSGKSHYSMMGFLRPCIRIDGTGIALEEDHLIIHLRAGDVFSRSSVHPGYGQAPIGFYQRVLESRRWGRVTLVAENDQNPIWAALKALCLKNHPTEVRMGRPLNEDLEFMLRSRCMIAARGTFGNAISALSTNLETVHFFESAFNCWGNPKVRAIRWIDTSGEYRREILCKNWKNSASQRKLMIDFPAEKIARSEL